MADTQPKDQTAAAKEQLAKNAEARKKSNEEAAKRMESAKPTPTQEENDMAKLGAPVEEKEDDGSGPEIVMQMTPRPVENKQLESEGKPAGAGYQTRQTAAKPAPGRSE